MEELTVILLLILLVCFIVYLLLNIIHAWKAGKELSPGRRVMLVTSHPDDEVMFFGPTILGLTQVEQ